MPSINENIQAWFKNEKILDHEDEIISFIQDIDNDLDELNYHYTLTNDGESEHHEESVIFWSAEPEYKEIFREVLKRSEVCDRINSIHPTKHQTVLSLVSYHGYSEIADMLLLANIKIEVTHSDDRTSNAYQKLGEGYWAWPKDVEDYRKIFRNILMKDSNKPRRRFFVDKYNLTQDKAYLACIMFYDHFQNKAQDKSNQVYKERSILTL